VFERPIRDVEGLAHHFDPFGGQRPKLSVVAPCYNEEACLDVLYRRVSEAARQVAGDSYEVVLIDDGSRDRSVELVRGFMARHEALHVVMRINRQGKGLAQNYFDGAFMGCGTYYRLVYGSNSEPVETMVDIFRSIGDADIVVPYYLDRLKRDEYLSFGGKLFNGFINLITGNRITCYTAQHMHLRYNVMRWHSDVLGQAFQLDLLCQLLALDFTCKQVPCRAVSTPNHYDSTGFRKFLSYAHAVLNIVFRRIARFMYARHR